MAANTNVTTTLTETMQTYYDKKLILDMQPKLVHYQHGQKRILPEGQGTSVNFRKWTPFPPVTTPLTEGVVPEGQSLSMTSIPVQIQQYGGYVAVSDLLDMTALDPVVNDSVELMAQQGSTSIDKLVQSALHQGTNVLYAKGRATRGAIVAGDVLTTDELRKAVRTLKKNKAPQFMRGGKGYYVAIVGPDTVYDLQNDTAWRDVTRYQHSEQLFSGEIGTLFGVIVVEAPETMLVQTEGIPVASTLVFGKNAYGVVDLAGGNVKTIVKPRGSAGASDPLEQISTIGWKVDGFAAKILQSAWLVRVEHAVSA